MNLYKFDTLSKQLDYWGFPKISAKSGYQPIKVDFTKAEEEGYISYENDGIYFTYNGIKQKGYLYLKHANVARYGLPKFHIMECETIITQKEAGRFHGRYFWSNTAKVEITGVTESVNLGLCGYCRKIALEQPHDTEEFYQVLDKEDVKDLNKTVETDIFGYVSNWQEISKAYRTEQNYTCENCKIQINNPLDYRFLHTHHKNGDKTNNSRSNLECLCVLCHAFEDKHHGDNFDRRRMKSILESFIVKYKNELIKVKNKYINR